MATANKAETVTTRLFSKARGRNRPATYGVFLGSGLVGMLERYQGTTAHPWKAYGASPGATAAVGGFTAFLGAYYPHEGGQDSAVQAVVTHHRALQAGAPSPYVKRPTLPVSPGPIGGPG